MTQHDIYKHFEQLFPVYSGDNARDGMWFTNGKDSIRVRLKNGQAFIFTYKGKNDWRLETLKSYLSSTKPRKE